MQMRLVPRVARRLCDLGEISGISRVHLGEISRISRVHLGEISPEPEVRPYPPKARHASNARQRARRAEAGEHGR